MLLHQGNLLLQRLQVGLLLGLVLPQAVQLGLQLLVFRLELLLLGLDFLQALGGHGQGRQGRQPQGEQAAAHPLADTSHRESPRFPVACRLHGRSKPVRPLDVPDAGEVRPVAKNLGKIFSRGRKPAPARQPLTFPSAYAKIFLYVRAKALKETGGGVGALQRAGGWCEPARETRGRIPPEPRAQQGFPAKPPVSAAGTPPLPGRVLLDMPEWVV